MAGKAKEMINLRFGRLTVKDKHGIKNETITWNCICDCGKEIVVNGSSLRRKKRSTRSCGCLQREFAVEQQKKINNIIYSKEELFFITVKHHFLSGARGRKIQYELSDKHLLSLVSSKCYYCNSVPSNYINIGRSDLEKITYQGIDRIDSSLNYSDENTRPCCKYCNVAKGSMSEQDFLKHISNIYKNIMNGKNQ